MGFNVKLKYKFYNIVFFHTVVRILSYTVKFQLYYHSFVESCNFTNKANLNTFEVEMHTQQNYAILATQFRKRGSKWAGVFIWENFHPGCQDLSCRNRDLGNQASPPSHMNTSQYLQRK